MPRPKPSIVRTLACRLINCRAFVGATILVRSREIAFKIDRLGFVRAQIVIAYYPPDNDISPSGFKSEPRRGGAAPGEVRAHTTDINCARAQQKARHSIFTGVRGTRSVDQRELVSFVISRAGGTEVISLDVRVNDFPLARGSIFSGGRKRDATRGGRMD